MKTNYPIRGLIRLSIVAATLAFATQVSAATPPQMGSLPPGFIFNGLVMTENRVYTGAITITDPSGNPNTVTLSVVSSSDPTVIPTSGVTFGGAGTANRTIVITPATNQSSGGNTDVRVRLTSQTTLTSDYVYRIIVDGVNLPPVFTPGPTSITVSQNSSLYNLPWATGIAPCAGFQNIFEANQVVTFIVSNDNNALFSTQPSVSTNGVLTFQPARNQKGVAQVSIFLKDNGASGIGRNHALSLNTSATTILTLTVSGVPIPPTITLPSGVGPAQVAPENRSVSFNVNVAEVNDSLANVSITGTSDQTNVIDASCIAQTSAGTTNPRTITITPKVNQITVGTAHVTLTATNSNTGLTGTLSMTVGVNYGNQPPIFTSGGNVSVNENSGAYSAQWATGIAPCAPPISPSEASQSIQFLVSATNPSLFSVQPGITATNPAQPNLLGGYLKFTPATNAKGTSTLTVYAKDSGGANSTTQQFTITIVPISIPPVITPEVKTIGVAENGSLSFLVDLTDANDSVANVTITGTSDNPAVIDSSCITEIARLTTSKRSILIAPKPNAIAANPLIVTLVASNSVTGLSGTNTVKVTVNWANQPPVFTIPSSNAVIQVDQNSGAYTQPLLTGIAAAAPPLNSYETQQVVSFTVSNSDSGLFSIQPTISSTVTPQPGRLDFTPASNGAGTATVTVTAVDNGPGGGGPGGANNTSAPQTFTIIVNPVLIPPHLWTYPTFPQTPVGLENGSIQYIVAITDVNDDTTDCTISAVSDNPTLIDSSGISIESLTSAGHTLFPGVIGKSSAPRITLTPKANQFGTANITLTASNRVTHAQSLPFSFKVTFNYVNQPPVFTPGPSVVFSPQNVGFRGFWASQIYPCAYPSNSTEASQTVGFTVSNDANQLFSVQPAIFSPPAPNSIGQLTFQPALNAKGTAHVFVYAKDSGAGSGGVKVFL